MDERIENLFDTDRNAYFILKNLNDVVETNNMTHQNMKTLINEGRKLLDKIEIEYNK